jgi:hypothetical protein
MLQGQLNLSNLAMHKILRLLMALSAISSGALAQQLSANKVPPVVRQACEAKFSRVRKVEWKLKNDHSYEAEFRMNGVEVAAKFDANGNWLETETTIARTKLPSDVRATISKNFSSYKLIETQTVERFDQKLRVYEVHLEDLKEVLKILFEENGTLVSQSSKPKKHI